MVPPQIGRDMDLDLWVLSIYHVQDLRKLKRNMVYFAEKLLFCCI